MTSVEAEDLTRCESEGRVSRVSGSGRKDHTVDPPTVAYLYCVWPGPSRRPLFEMSRAPSLAGRSAYRMGKTLADFSAPSAGVLGVSLRKVYTVRVGTHSTIV